MGIVSAEIHNQSFSIDRKGYDVDEVDVFLEHVANEIDVLNEIIMSLEGQQVDEDRFDGFDTVATPVQEPVVDEEALAEKDEIIADLERQLEAKKADDNAISQALIIAQRSADEVLSKAKAEAQETIREAEAEARRIVDKAEGDKQKVIDAIKKLEDDREDSREEYQELLTDFITDASRKLAEIGAPVSASAHARAKNSTAVVASGAVAGAGIVSSQAPLNFDGAGAYAMPQAANNVIVAAATPTPSAIDKDLSGFGDADDGFEFEELD